MLYYIIDDIVSDDNSNLRGQIDRVVMEEMNSLFKLFATHNIVKIRLAIFNELPLNHVDCLEERLYNDPTNIQSPFDINVEFEELRSLNYASLRKHIEISANYN